VKYLRFVLWALLLLTLFTPVDYNPDNQQSWRDTIELCVILICLTWSYK
jgi:predicted ferric reductase